MKAMLTLLRSAGLPASSTSPAEMLPEPVLDSAAPVRMGAAAATRPGSVNSTLMPWIAPAVGVIL